MADDNHSVASGGSATNTKIECPHCSKEVQARVMFNHIRKLHRKELIDTSMNIKEAENGKALEVMWFKKNDFDEEEAVVIYACMATNKTFTIESRANAHFKKNPDALKEHKKEMKKLMKQIEEEKKKSKPHPLLLKYHQDKKSNCPILARIMWRAIQYHEIGCKKILYNVKRVYKPEVMEKYVMRCGHFLRDQNTLKQWMDALEDKLCLVDEMRRAQNLEVDQLERLMVWLEGFIIASLPLLDGEVFDWFRCCTNDQSIRPKEEDLEEDLYYLASSSWPSVDF
jgi:hypothetical protein